MTMKKLLLLIALFFSAPAFAVITYVSDCGTGAHASCVPGDNGNDGLSAAAPKQSVTAATIRAAASGDVFRFSRGGAWNSSPFVSLYKSGSDGANVNANITVEPYDPPSGATGLPRFNVASGACVSFSGEFGDLAWDGPWTIDGIDCRGTGASAGAAFLLSRYTRGVTIKNSRAENWETGFLTYENHYDLVLKDNTLQTIYSNGFLSVSSLVGFVADGNTFVDTAINAPTSGPTEHAFYLGCSETPGCKNVVLKRNILRNSAAQTGNGNRCGGGTLTVHGNVFGALIENNFIDNSQYGHQSGCLGISLTAQYDYSENMTNFVVRGNRIVDAGTCVTTKSAPGVIIENNICTMSQAGYGGIAFGFFPRSVEDAADTGAVIRNNLLWIASATGSAIGFDTNVSTATGVVVSGNVIRFGSTSGTNYCFEHRTLGNYTSYDRNHCYSASGTVNWSTTYSTLGAAQAAGFDPNSGNADPNLVAAPASGNEFAACAVNTGSPLINAGSSTYGSRLSFKGRTPSGVRDAGPCEFGVD